MEVVVKSDLVAAHDFCLDSTSFRIVGKQSRHKTDSCNWLFADPKSVASNILSPISIDTNTPIQHSRPFRKLSTLIQVASKNSLLDHLKSSDMSLVDTICAIETGDREGRGNDESDESSSAHD